MKKTGIQKIITILISIMLVLSLASCPEDDLGDGIVTGVNLNRSTITLYTGEIETLTATVLPASAPNKNVTWSSSNGDVAFVVDGSVIAQAPGTTTIYVTTQDGEKTAFCVVTVYDIQHSNINRFQAIQNIDTGKIKYSYHYAGLDFYYIYLGQMANIPIFSPGNASYHHDGGSPYTFKYSETHRQEINIENIITNSSSITTATAESNTNARSEGETKSWEAGGGVSTKVNIIPGIWSVGGKAEGKTGGETRWDNFESKTNTHYFQEERSNTNSVKHGASYARETMIGMGFSLSRDNRPGYYRKTMFAVSDVYLYIVRDRSTGDIYYEFKEHVIPDNYSWRLEFTENLPFGKSDDSTFLIEMELLENLPVPTTIFNFLETVDIPAGTLNRSYATPSHTISLNAFKMGKYPVTQEQYLIVMGIYNPSTFKITLNHPVETLTWFDAIEFCNRLSTMEGLTPVYTITGRTPASGFPITNATVTANWSANGYRLPTEAEWEYAVRAGTDPTWNWYFGNDPTGKEIEKHAWFLNNNPHTSTHEVGKKLANPWGLHDMYGNVFEWCWDWNTAYPSGPQTNYRGPDSDSGTSRINRGPCYNSALHWTYSSFRGARAPNGTWHGLGFRVVRNN